MHIEGESLPVIRVTATADEAEISREGEIAEELERVCSRTFHTVVHMDGWGTAFSRGLGAVSVSARILLLALSEKPAEGYEVFV